MILNKLQITHYKNIREAELLLSPKINGFIGQNGAGKTNVLDAVYYLSFCRSASNVSDSQVICHGEDFFVLEGLYDDGLTDIYCGMRLGQKKHFKRNKKEYRRLSEHIGRIPIVLVSPGDTLLIDGSSEERRRFIDTVVAQQDNTYIDALNRYNKALQQRNSLLKQEDGMPDLDLLALWEEQMAQEGERIYERRSAMIERLVPVFQKYYTMISGSNETVSLGYVSHCQRGPLLEVIQRDRHKDLAVGYSLHGIHRDDMVIMLNGHSMKHEGSQGQHKTFVIALKLAQFELLKSNSQPIENIPLLLLDDIFDKLDANRVEQIVKIVAGEDFGQIFITDTNREHLDQILSHTSAHYNIYNVEDGKLSLRSSFLQSV